MSLKTLGMVLASLPSENQAVPVRSVAIAVTDQDTQAVVKLFDQLKAIFTAWQQAFPTPEMQALGLREWTVALVEANCTSREQLSRGMRVARAKARPWFPSTGEFIQWCEITPELLGLPVLDAALVEVRTGRFTHPAVALAAQKTRWFRQTLSQDEYRTVFKQTYYQLLHRVEAGEDLGGEVIKGLPFMEQTQHSTEYYQQTGQRGVESLKALFKR